MRSRMFVLSTSLLAAACQEDIADGPARAPVYTVEDRDGDWVPTIYDDHNNAVVGYLEDAEIAAILESEGWSGSPDCNDDNPTVYPGSPEPGRNCGENPA